MGDKDLVKKFLLDLYTDLVIGRVNMKPGCCRTSTKYRIVYFCVTC